MPTRTAILGAVGSPGAVALLEQMLQAGPTPQSRLVKRAAVVSGTASKRFYELSKLGIVERETAQGPWELRVPQELRTLLDAADQLGRALDGITPVTSARASRPRRAA